MPRGSALPEQPDTAGRDGNASVDCGADARVTVDELVLLVRRARLWYATGLERFTLPADPPF